MPTARRASLHNWASQICELFSSPRMLAVLIQIRIGTPEVAELVSKVAAIYSPELKVGFTPVSLFVVHRVLR